MTVRELREKYLRFFESKGHQVHPSGSLIPYDVTGRLDESLLFNGAGMVQFKPYFRGVAHPPCPRLATAQKCVRTGDIESVGNLSHLTFFEMLGNFSFGDYFKAQAIAYSWEFLTSPEWLGLEPRRLAFTVFEEDDEAYDEWARWLIPAGIDPETRIFRLGEETNYWPAGAFSSGPPGPCGPNSEMFYWVSNEEPPPSGPYSGEHYLRDDASGKWLEIWNDVFIQFEWQGHLRNPERPADGWEKDGMPPLPFQSIDTGMGLERTAAVLGGFASVYDTDAFVPVIEAIDQIGRSSGGSYRPYSSADPSGREARATRIIADHIRTAVFCIADGVLPGNTGRGYVLRRLIRRAVLKGQRVLGFEEPFFHLVFEGVVSALGDHYTELAERRDVVVETLRNEESLFRRTIASGSEVLQDLLTRLSAAGAGAEKVLGGADAFKLYDTYGFPLEVTQELAEEAGVEVDLEGYERALAEAQERSRSTHGMDTVYGSVTIQISFDDGAATPTVFRGYEALETEATIVGAVPQVDEGGRSVGNLVVALSETPFYAESGGQVSDQGRIVGDGFELEVIDMYRQDGVYVHLVKPNGLSSDPQEQVERVTGQKVRAAVDPARRRRIVRNHTATHLLHAALREVLGRHVTQAGSYVGPDRLRFDFTHGRAMTPDELARVEGMVNEQALANTPVKTYADIPIQEAKERGAMALFGEKYGERVRMVEVGEFSRELCGGTHVRSTGEIGLFKILAEASAASGVRRIEAVTGEGAYEWVLEESGRLKHAASLLKTSPREVVSAIERLVEAQRDLARRLERMRQQGSAAPQAQTLEIDGIELAVQRLDEGDAKDATAAVDRLVESAPNRVALVGAAGDGRVTIAVKVGPEALARGAHAGNLVREVARIAGGGGGGRADFATAGGKLPEKLDEALRAAEGVLRAMMG